MLGVAGLLVIEEAAAIPLPLGRKLMGRYVVFIASTVHGYEGTDRALTHKLIDELKMQSRNMPNGSNVAVDRPGEENKDLSHAGHRTLRACTLSEPIRYAKGDAVE